MSKGKKLKALLPGASIRVYVAPDGRDIVGQFDSGQLDSVDVRHLPPGAYVARDELGGFLEFTVEPLVEFVRLPVRGGVENPVAEPVQDPRERRARNALAEEEARAGVESVDVGDGVTISSGG